MPSHRLTLLPLPSVATKVASLDDLMLLAILSSMKSHETLFHPLAPEARYRGDPTRRGEVASCIAVAPFGHRRPSLTVLSGSPSIWRSCVFPSLVCRVYATSVQPTAKYVQIDCDSLAPAIRSECWTLFLSSSATTKPSGYSGCSPCSCHRSSRSS